MKLSDLKPGDRFRMASLPTTTFTLINPRVGIFSFSEKIRFVYVSENNQLYGSTHDYEVVPIKGYDNDNIKLKYIKDED